MKVANVVFVVSVVFFTADAVAQYVTDFESPPFVSGEINGQDSWTTDQNFMTARVLMASEIATELSNVGLDSSMPVHSGSQAAMVSGSGNGTATIRAISGLSTEPNVVLDVWTRPLTGNMTGNAFVTMEDPSGVNGRAAAFRFGPNSSLDYGTNLGGVWRPTGTLWDPNNWYRITLTLDYVNKTYDFAINGTRINTTPITFYNPNSTGLTQIRIFRGANQSGMLIDDLLVAVPEPGTTSCMLIGAGVALVTRRKR